MPLISSPPRGQDLNGQWRRLTILLSFAFAVSPCLPSPVAGNPHAPATLAWEVISPTGQVVWSIEGTHTPGSWWPTLHPDVCQLAVGLDRSTYWDIEDYEDPNNIPMTNRYTSLGYEVTHDGDNVPGCRSPRKRSLLRALAFYACPKDDRSRQKARECGGPESLYCAAWGCALTEPEGL